MDIEQLALQKRWWHSMHNTSPTSPGTYSTQGEYTSMIHKWLRIDIITDSILGQAIFQPYNIIYIYMTM